MNNTILSTAVVCGVRHCFFFHGEQRILPSTDIITHCLAGPLQPHHYGI